MAKIESQILFGGTPQKTPAVAGISEDVDTGATGQISTSNGQSKNSGVSATEGTEGRRVTGISTPGTRGGGGSY